MDDKDKLDLDDLAARPREVGSDAAEALTGGLLKPIMTSRPGGKAPVTPKTTRS